ncbi:MAG: glycosyltransferase family 2 protein [Lachnospiraceae bacterium]|jgi:glycosyltransferase involved in cell wall biosynthesis|nr:glycosyltransferase family 2 protein [Lachnospiraceae bacterium]
MVKVSICIPAYNNEQSVRRLLASVEKQIFQDYEVIITDDSTGDGIGKLAEEKDYVKYYKNPVPLGAAANWNEAVGKSGGEYVKIMHHDDWFTDENSLGAFVDMLEQHPEADLAFSGSRQEEAERSYDRSISADDAALIREDYRNLFLGNTIGAPSAVIVRRSALRTEEIVYDEKLTWLVDMEYYMHILKGNPRFIYTEKPLISIGIDAGQLTETCRDNKELNAFEYGYICRKYQLEKKEEYRRKLAVILADAKKSGQEAESYGIRSEEYRKIKREKLLSAIRWKITHLFNEKNIRFLLVILFILSLLPLLWLAPVNHATGDDFGYGRLTREAWVQTHSIAEVAKAAGRTVRDYYYGWQGTWLSVFLFSLQPEVFLPEGGYIIVPFLMLALWMGSTWILCRYLLVKKAGFSNISFAILYVLFAMAGIQFVPKPKSAVFWYNGTAHYIVPYAIALLGIYFYFRFVDMKKGLGVGSYVGLSVCLALLGGGNYQAALLAPGVILLLAFCRWKEKRKRGRVLLCIFPLLLEMAGLVVSMKAPGNKVRGGADFGMDISLAVETVVSCFVRGAVQAWEYTQKHPLLLLLFAAAAVVLWHMPEENREKWGYPHPWLFAILSYCVYCSMFAPEIYAGVEVSGGVYNMNYYIFLFMAFGNMIYIAGALRNRLACRGGNSSPAGRRLLFGAALLAIVYLYICKGDLKSTLAYCSLEYITSGQAADFKAQMELQNSVLLDDDVKDVVLPMINDDQGPLMHMPLTENPDEWTNMVTRLYYNKNSVVAIPREVWQELQGR